MIADERFAVQRSDQYSPERPPSADPLSYKKDSDEEDDDDDDDDNEFSATEVRDTITAQFEKVQRTKQKYKCIFKDVIIHMNGRDFVVRKMTAEIEY